MCETWKQTGINGLIFLIFPAAYLLVGRTASARWPQADLSGYWRWAGIGTGVLYAFAVGITFIAGYVGRNDYRYTQPQAIPDTFE